jgi:site-specific DNA recombinase
LLNVVKSRKKKDQEHILFIKLDRFSGNIEFAYQMIGILRNINVQAMAIDQPIDFKIPESTVMLAVYLAVPESENTRRALNTLTGMRRAKLSGRWISSAPKGYENLSHPDGRKYIAPKNPEAGLMRWVFTELSNGIFNAEQVRKIAYTKGLKCERNNFWKIIRNPVYCGAIVVPPYEDQEMQFVKGQHEPLISESLFYDVQDVLNGNKRKIGTKIVSADMLPLRGFLECPESSRMLTGSASKGRRSHYYYYHCSDNNCKCRFKAEEVNAYFEKELFNLQLAPAIAAHYKEIVMDVFKSEHREDMDERKAILTEIEKQETMLSNSRKQIAAKEIEPDDFKAIKAACNKALKLLEDKLAELPGRDDSLKTVDHLLDKLIDKFSNIQMHFKRSTVAEKRKLIGSMYPKNLCFDENRTSNRLP